MLLENETHAPLLERGFKFGKAVEQKLIVAEIAMRVERDRCKKNYDRLMQRITRINREVEGRVVDRSLCTLHPVHNNLSMRGRGSVAANTDAWIGF